jgi:DNA-directed RNA polymerase subunit alpha
MLSVSLPKAPKYKDIDQCTGQFIIEDCYPGFGTTLGNALRRVLLSSLPGSAITSVKIKGVTHEFTTLKGVMEDMVQIILNLKKVRFKLHSVEKSTVTLKVKGEREVTAADIKSTSEVEVVNGDQHIATLTASSAELEMEMTIEQGMGYVPIEQQIREEKEIGAIAIDAIYTPVRRVNFIVDNMRVGKRTDYDRIKLDIITDGTIYPQDAYGQAVNILLSQFREIATMAEEEKPEEVPVMQEAAPVAELPKKAEKPKKVVDMKKLLSSMKLSTRTLNVLDANNIKTIDDVAVMTEEALKELEGMGEKGIKEIKKAIGTMGVTLKG